MATRKHDHVSRKEGMNDYRFSLQHMKIATPIEQLVSEDKHRVALGNAPKAFSAERKLIRPRFRKHPSGCLEDEEGFP